MMQGDAFTQEIEIRHNDEIVTPDDVTDVEITIGVLSKTYLDGELDYSEGVWKFPMTQQETFRFRGGYHSVQVRVLWPSGDIEGVDLGKIYVGESNSRRMLGVTADE